MLSVRTSPAKQVSPRFELETKPEYKVAVMAAGTVFVYVARAWWDTTGIICRISNAFGLCPALYRRLA
jgi:hypothetical protein